MISAKSEKKQTSGVGTKLDIQPKKLAGIHSFVEISQRYWAMPLGSTGKRHASELQMEKTVRNQCQP